MTATGIQQFMDNAPWAFPLVVVLGLWSITWSAIGLWVAARNGHKAWFVVFLLVHTLGVLEMLYLWSQRRTNGRG
ncbi:MAG: hypothetical protein RLZZ319_566 [Actinomycetota bacterium]|jgi:hypothetical protein